MKIERLLFLSAVLLLAIGGCGKKSPPPTTENTPAPSGNPITAPVDYLGAVAKAKQSADKTLVLAGLKQSLQQFFVNEGHYPKALNELVRPDLLSKIPDPPRGMKYSYNPATGDLKLVPQ